MLALPWLIRDFKSFGDLKFETVLLGQAPSGVYPLASSAGLPWERFGGSASGARVRGSA